MVVVLLDTKILLFQLVEKLYLKLKILSNLELTIHSFTTTSTRERYQIIYDEDLIFVMENHSNHIYLFVDAISKYKGHSVQVNEAPPYMNVRGLNMNIVIPTNKMHDV